MLNELYLKLFQGFSKLSKSERMDRLRRIGALTNEDIAFLEGGGLKSTDLAEKFIENALGYFQLPLGVATHFVIDEKPVLVPMAVEETSIIAAASKTAKWVRDHGTISTQVLGHEIIGQIQISVVQNREKLDREVNLHASEWIARANKEVAAGMVRRGGGVTRIYPRYITRPDGREMAVIHVLLNPCDAMGANIVNQVCEFLKGPIEEASGEKVTMCILSNLVDTKVTRARIEMKGVDEDLGRRIEEASLFANLDPYRAATNNKGVLNGIDPILIATGNDWRAVEAGVHAYAARDGHYRSITTWKWSDGVLQGEFLAPVVVGVVGGVTALHPAAKIAMQMLDVQHADDLSRICAAVGLTQNLGALRALTTVGIIEGHMKLHIRNLTLGAGATETEGPIVQKKLEQLLLMHKRISLHNAIEVLKELRAQS